MEKAGIVVFALIAAAVLLALALLTTPQVRTITPAQATATFGAHEWKLQQDAILLNGGTK